MSAQSKQPQSASFPLPIHIAIIMDGNGRWAKSRGLPRTAGHKKGADATQNTIESCAKLGIKYLTLYAFSSENWNRSQEEVQDLMNLLRYHLEQNLDTLNKNNIKLHIIGNKQTLDQDIQKKINKAETKTQHNTGLQLNIALSYGSRQEILDTVQHIANQSAAQKLNPEHITESYFSTLLYTHNTPDPDLLIRTGGEKRLSNFLLWQCAYTELVFTDILWPDFSHEHLLEAIEEFSSRERRFGTA